MVRRKDLLRKLLRPPPKLLFREAQLRAATAAVEEHASFRIEGPTGVGKTTLAILATSGVATTYVPGFKCRTYECLRGRVSFHALNVIDDYGLIVRSERVVSLIRSLPWKIVIVHPGLYAPEVEDLPRVWMPPYEYYELRQILLERVERLSLPVSTSIIERCALEAARYSGSAKLALLLLLEHLA